MTRRRTSQEVPGLSEWMLGTDRRLPQARQELTLVHRLVWANSWDAMHISLM